MKVYEKNFHHFVTQLLASGGIKRVSSFAIVSGLSRRMIYYYLDELNFYLKSHQTTAYIQGQKLTEKQQLLCQKLVDDVQEQEKSIIFSADEREMIMIYFLLFEVEKISIRFFEELFLISKNTVLKDIARVRVRLSNFHIDLQVNKVKGYYLEADLFRKYQFTYIFFHILSIPKLSMAQEFIIKHMHQFNQIWTDQNIEALILIVHNTSAVLLKKIAEIDALIIAQTLLSLEMLDSAHKLVLPNQFDEVIANRVEYTAASQLAFEFEQLLGRNILEVEQKIIGMYLLCVEKDIDEHYLAPHFKQLYDISNQVIALFECRYGIVFEQFDSVIKNVQTYMKVAYYRTLFHMHIPNKSYRVVLDRYPKVFQIVKRIMIEIAEEMPVFVTCFQAPFSNDMLSDLTLVFEDAILREQTRSYQLNTIIVSNSSKVERSLIQSHITQHLHTIRIVQSVPLKEVAKINQNIELCITTINNYTYHEGKTVYIQSVPTEEDIEKIQQLQYDFFYSRKRRSKVKYLLEEFTKTNNIDVALNEIEHVYTGLSKTRANRQNYSLAYYRQKKDHFYDWNKPVTLRDVIVYSAKQFLKRNSATEEYEAELISCVEDNKYYYKKERLIICGNYKKGAQHVDLQINYLSTPIFVNQKEVSTIYVLMPTETMLHVPLVFEIEDSLQE